MPEGLKSQCYLAVVLTSKQNFAEVSLEANETAKIRCEAWPALTLTCWLTPHTALQYTRWSNEASMHVAASTIATHRCCPADVSQTESPWFEKMLCLNSRDAEACTAFKAPATSHEGLETATQLYSSVGVLQCNPPLHHSTSSLLTCNSSLSCTWNALHTSSTAARLAKESVASRIAAADSMGASNSLDS